MLLLVKQQPSIFEWVHTFALDSRGEARIDTWRRLYALKHNTFLKPNHFRTCTNFADQKGLTFSLQQLWTGAELQPFRVDAEMFSESNDVFCAGFWALDHFVERWLLNADELCEPPL